MQFFCEKMETAAYDPKHSWIPAHLHLLYSNIVFSIHYSNIQKIAVIVSDLLNTNSNIKLVLVVFLYVSTFGNYTWHKWPENLVLFSYNKPVCSSRQKHKSFCQTLHNSTGFWCEAIIRFIQSLLVLSSLQPCNLYFTTVTLDCSEAVHHFKHNLLRGDRMFLVIYWLTSQYSIKTLLSNLKPCVVLRPYQMSKCILRNMKGVV